MQILSPVLDMLPSNLSIRLAAVASMKGLIDLEKWLNTNLSTYKDKFYEVVSLVKLSFTFTFSNFCIIPVCNVRILTVGLKFVLLLIGMPKVSKGGSVWRSRCFN